ncbi:MAG: membrane protein of unknown function [Candidatus Thorarchaeota archaeon]|nr:MAG: membrane protein of unknown function [Candidatus Thorarchaeota archaeon]
MVQDSVDSDKKTAATCIFCGKSIAKSDIVRYNDWIAHKTCARQTVEESKQTFSPILFKIGAIGPLVAILLTLPILSLVVSSGWLPRFFSPTWEAVAFYFYCNIDYMWVVNSFFVLSIGFLGSSIGFIAVSRNYNEGIGLLTGILSVVTGALLLGSAIWLNSIGSNPIYYDSETGLIVYSEIFGYLLVRFTIMMLGGLTTVFFGISLLILQEYLGYGQIEGIIALVLGGIGFVVPIVLLVQLGLFAIMFLRFGFPKRIDGIVDIEDLE